LINFVARQADHKDHEDGPIIQQAKGWLIIVGEGDVAPALEMGIRFLETGQTGQIWSHSKYALGPGSRTHENYTLPPNSSVMYEVTVTQIVVDTSRLNPYFPIQKALTKKNIANDIYQYEWVVGADTTMAMQRAVRLYQKAAKDLETLLNGVYFQQVEQDHAQKLQARQIMLDALNNTTAVFLRQEEYHKAKQAAVEVLTHDPKNLKALLRASKAALLDPASTLEEAEAAMKAAEAEVTYKNPNEEKEVKRLKVQFQKFKKDYKEKSKEMYGKMMKPSKVEVEQPKEEASKKVNIAEKIVEFAETKMAEVAREKAAAEKETTNNNTAEDDETKELPKDDGKFWHLQAFLIALNILIPLACYFLFQHYRGAETFSLATTMAAKDSIVDDSVTPPDEDTIEL
jgi:hypothetical protein